MTILINFSVAGYQDYRIHQASLYVKVIPDLILLKNTNKENIWYRFMFCFVFMTNTFPQSAFFVPARKLWAKHAGLAGFDGVSIHSYSPFSERV